MSPLSEDIAIVRIEHDTVLLDLRTGRYFALNRVGFEMIRALLSTGDTLEAVGRLADIIDADRNTLHEDLKDFTQQLAALGLTDQSTPLTMPGTATT